MDDHVALINAVTIKDKNMPFRPKFLDKKIVAGMKTTATIDVTIS